MGEKGFRPTSPRLHRKSGKCALCGQFMPLTLAHVPPRAAFNDGAGSLGGVDGDDALAYGRPRTGGLRIPAHCESCRAQTSPWDDEYILWAREFAGILVQSEWKGQRTEVSGKLRNVRPGRFIRAALAGMTALASNLIDTHPALVRTVREGVADVMPPDLRFLVGIAPDRTTAHIEGAHGGIVASVSAGRELSWPTLSAVIHFPPFSLLLADEALTGDLPHADASQWLEFDVNEIVAEIEFVAIPVVVFSETPTGRPVPLSMLRFQSATV